MPRPTAELSAVPIAWQTILGGGHWTSEAWGEYLATGETESEIAEIRRCTHTGRPLGSEDFVHSLEHSMNRRLAPLKGGRPKRSVVDANQGKLDL